MQVAERPGGATRPAEGEAKRLLERELPSGKLLLVLQGQPGSPEEIQLRSPTGEVEVRIVCGPAGPEVSVRAAARLELAAPTVAVRCHDLDVRATGEMRLKAEADVHMNGAMLRLNCTDPAPDRTS